MIRADFLRLAPAGVSIPISPKASCVLNAIGGVLGAYVLMCPRVHVHLLLVLGFHVTTIAVPVYFMLGYGFLLQLASGADRCCSSQIVGAKYSRPAGGNEKKSILRIGCRGGLCRHDPF